MKKLFWKECVKMKNKHVSLYIYFKKKRFILLVSIVSFVITILVVIGVVLIAMGLFHQEDSMSTLNLGNTGIEKAAMAFYWMFRIFHKKVNILQHVKL